MISKNGFADETGRLDNVSIPTYLHYLAALGLTVEPRQSKPVPKPKGADKLEGFMDNPTAQQAYRLLSQGRVHEFSIGGFEPAESVTWTEDGIRHIGRFDLAEVSLTLKGANPDTRLIDVKADEPDEPDGPVGKAGRVLAGRHVETLKGVSSSLSDVKKTLDGLIKEVDHQEDPSDDGNEGKSEPPSDKSRVAAIAAARIALAMTRRRNGLARISSVAVDQQTRGDVAGNDIVFEWVRQDDWDGFYREWIIDPSVTDVASLAIKAADGTAAPTTVKVGSALALEAVATMGAI